MHRFPVIFQLIYFFHLLIFEKFMKLYLHSSSFHFDENFTDKNKLPSFWQIFLITILWILFIIFSQRQFRPSSSRVDWIYKLFLFSFSDFFGLGWTQNRRRSWVEEFAYSSLEFFARINYHLSSRLLVEEMLEKTLIIRPSSTFLLLYTSCWTLGNPFTYHHSPHFPALPRRLYALMIEWISQLKTILSDGHNGLRGSSSFLMSQNIWKWPKKVSR